MAWTAKHWAPWSVNHGQIEQDKASLWAKKMFFNFFYEDIEELDKIFTVFFVKFSFYDFLLQDFFFLFEIHHDVATNHNGNQPRTQKYAILFVLSRQKVDGDEESDNDWSDSFWMQRNLIAKLVAAIIGLKKSEEGKIAKVQSCKTHDIKDIKF